MSSTVDISRLHALTSQLCDGDICAQELDELAAMLAGNKQSIEEYLDHTSLHLAVSERLREFHSVSDQVGERIASTEISVPQAGASRLPGKRMIRRLPLLLLAASLLIAAVGVVRYGPLGTPDTARITEAIDCDWSEQHWGTPKSAAVVAGQEIKLDSGLMVLNFGNGAEVTVEAPVHFTVLASDRGRLDFGKLTAYVPEKAHGFTVALPQANIVDLGTRFGAIVSEDGTSETHVFQGKVLVESAHGERKDHEWTLAAGSALRLGVDGNDVKQFAAKPRSFVRLDFADPTGTIDSSTISIPSESRLVLWFDAARRLQLDEAGRVVSWGDSRAGNGGSDNNAWQVKAKKRPLWIRDALNRRSAVRFDGSSYLVTTPISSGNDVTLLCVFRGTSREPGEILNLNGPPTLVLQARRNELIGKVVSTTGNLPLTSGSMLKSPLPDDNSPVVAAYVYNRTEAKASMYLNGTPVAESQALLPVAVRSPKFIGASSSRENFFNGDVFEILLFDSSLTAENCAQVSTDLMRKYGVVKVEREPRILARPAQSVQ
jgi:FecR protein